MQDRDSAYLTVPYSGTGTCLSTVTASRWSTPSATCRPDRHCQNTRPVMPGVRFMTNLMQSMYLQIAPENNKENQFIDFRLIPPVRKTTLFPYWSAIGRPVMPGVFFARAQASPASTRPTAHGRWPPVIETGIVHAQLAQRLLKRKQILGVGERPAGPGDQRAITRALVSGSNSGWRGSIINTGAFTVRPSSAPACTVWADSSR